MIRTLCRASLTPVVMRFVLPLIALLYALPARAQTPLVANAPLPGTDVLHTTGEPVPDTTDWRSYFPMEIGNEWQYRITTPEGGEGYYGYNIIGDTLVDEEPYFLVKTCYLREPILCTGTDSTLFHQFVRYSPDDALILERYEVQGSPRVGWYERVPCLLDASFESGPTECPEPGRSEYFIDGGYGYIYVLEPDTLRDVTFKVFDSIPTITGVVGGVGVIYTIDTKNSQNVEELVYARINGEEYGTQEFFFPTVEEPEPLPSLNVGITALYPNPVRDRATLVVRLTKASPVFGGGDRHSRTRGLPRRAPCLWSRRAHARARRGDARRRRVFRPSGGGCGAGGASARRNEVSRQEVGGLVTAWAFIII